MKPYIELKVKEQGEKALKEEAKAEQENKKNLELSIERCQNLIKYFEEIERALVDHGAKTWAELNPVAAAALGALKKVASPSQTIGTLSSSATQNVTDSEEFLAKHYKAPSVPLSFTTLTQWFDQPAPVHTVPLYEELFEACWKGDNERIKELCLPPKTGKRNKDTEYLQITCAVHFNPDVPHQPYLDDNVRAVISSFKEYPHEVQKITSGKSIKASIGSLVTHLKAIPLCMWLSSLETGKRQRSSSLLQRLNTKNLPTPLDVTNIVVSYSWVSLLIPDSYPQKSLMKRTMRTRI